MIVGRGPGPVRGILGRGGRGETTEEAEGAALAGRGEITGSGTAASAGAVTGEIWGGGVNA